MAQITGCLQKNKLCFTILAVLSAALLCTVLLYAVLSRVSAKNLAACSFYDDNVFPKEEIFNDNVQPGCKLAAEDEKEERLDEHVVESKAVMVEDSPTGSNTASLSVTSDVDEDMHAVDQELEGVNEVSKVVASDCEQSNPDGGVVQVESSDKNVQVTVDDVEPLENVSSVLLGCNVPENNEAMILNTDKSGLLQCDRGKLKGYYPNEAMRLVNKGRVRFLIDKYNELDRVALLEAKRASKNFRGTFSRQESTPSNPRKVGEIMADKDNEE